MVTMVLPQGRARIHRSKRFEESQLIGASGGRSEGTEEKETKLKQTIDAPQPPNHALKSFSLCLGCCAAQLLGAWRVDRTKALMKI